MSDPTNQEFNPFDEEFDEKDVMNRGDAAVIEGKKEYESEIIKAEEFEKREDPEFSMDNFSEDDIDQIIKYDDERRKKIGFRNTLDGDTQISDEKPDFENNFNDFLVAPKITGKKKFTENPNLLDAKFSKDEGRKVEISDDPHLFDEGHQKASVLVNRDEKGDVDNIQILCSCGERILLKFEFAEVFDEELTRQSIDRVDKPRPFQTAEIGIVADESYYPELIDDPEDVADDFDESPKENVMPGDELKLDAAPKEESKANEQFGIGEIIEDDELDYGELDLTNI